MNGASKPVAIIMGSQSDWAVMRRSAETLKALGVGYDARIVSAHRTPDRLVAFAKGAKREGFKVVIAGAGGAAHLPGMTAAFTTLPVFGVPVPSKALSGQDSLLSIVQMPAGVPVGTLAIGEAGAVNAALLACAVLALSDEALAARLEAWRAKRTAEVAERPADEGAGDDPRTRRDDRHSGQRPARAHARHRRAQGWTAHPYFRARSRGPGIRRGRRANGRAFRRRRRRWRSFAEAVDVVTYEFENVPVKTVEFLAARVPVRPGARALALTQDRLVEKTFLSDLGLKTAPFVGVEDAGALARAVAELGRPAILKTRRFGYDGKGQSLIREGSNVAAVHRAALERRHRRCFEGFVAFEREAWSSPHAASREIVAFDLSENEHEKHILARTRAPARVSAETAAEARRIASAILEALDYVGVLAVELFVTRDRQGREGLVVNEIAPRVHNSAHWTLEGAQTSQFEQHIRAIAGWPLGAPTRRGRAEMHNLIGEDAEEWRDILAQPDLCLHLYGKLEIRPDRKMGHVTRIFPETPAQD